MSEPVNTTEALIRRLSAQPAVREAGPSLLLPLAMVSAALVAFGAVLALLGFRDDLSAALAGVGGQKMVAGAVTAVGAATFCRDAAQPVSRWWPRTLPVLGLLAYLGPALHSGAPLGAWRPLLSDPAGPVCFATILAISLVPLGIIFASLRHSAPAHPFMAGLAAGCLAAGLAACAYSLNCTADGVGVVSFWYPTSITVVTLVGGLLGSRWLVW